MMRRRCTIGIGIGAASIRLIMATEERVVAHCEATFNDASELPDALATALDEMLHTAPAPRPRLAAAALAPDIAHVRPISPAAGTTSVKALQTQISDNIARYFMASTGTLVVAPPAAQRNGQTWVTAFRRETLEQLCKLCDTRKLILVAGAPTVVAIRLATSDAQVVWRDNGSVSHVSYDSNGELRSLRRLAADDDPLEPPTTIARPLGAIGPDAWRFADAFGAATLARTKRSAAMALRGGALPRSTGHGGARLVVASGVALFALSVAAVTPALAARRDAARARGQLRASEVLTAAATAAYRDVRTTSRLIDAIGLAVRERRAMTVAVATLTKAIPDSAFLVDLRLDGAGGTLVVIAPRAASVVTALATVRDVDAPTLMGAVMPQVVDSAKLERATIRFRWTERRQ